MNKDIFIEIGKEKVINGSMKNQFDELDDKTFEILGATKADYYGRTTINDIKKTFDMENEIYDFKFYKYVEYELKECSFIDALKTPEFGENHIFIFSKAPEGKRLYYVVQIINY